jgi:hypothetical protein
LRFVELTILHLLRIRLKPSTLSTFKCYESNTASSTSTANVAAGGVIGFKADNTFYHPGYFDVYMCAVAQANVESAGSGSCWFKVHPTDAINDLP